MSKFITELSVKLISEDPEQWRIISPLCYHSDIAGEIINVPSGTKTDFGSVPRIPLAYWLCGGVGDRAAVVHDYLYSGGAVPREKCDAIFREALLACGVSAWKAYLMWSMARSFGGLFYKGGK